MNANRVVIYSNGIADFQRCYEVGAAAPRRISIPVRRDHLADVLGSFNVYGKVRLESPPTFRPSNELEGNISINPEQVLEGLATSLSGAKVRVERAAGAVEGTLMGLHQEEEATTGEPIHSKSIIVLGEEGLRRCLLREIQSFQFLDEDVQMEIDKALRRHYQRIKPNSTFVELVLSTAEEKVDAVVQYTIPAAAWKISYRLRMAEGRATELQGFAIVDNNTDEDWADFHVCVVTGEPITFSTDLAASKTPKRQHVDLVSETALGAVEVEATMARAARPRGMQAAEAEAHIPRFFDADDTGMSLQKSRVAETTKAKAQEVGDLSIFESEAPVTIPAKRSTVIPVFNVEVADTKPVLHYRHENHPNRPFRSIDFTNRTGFSLGRGVCTVFEQAAYAGNCILPALKPDESRLLPHALETGLSVRRDKRGQRSKVVALRLSKGCCYTSTRHSRETHYHLKNGRDEPYQCVLDHSHSLVEPDIEARLIQGDREEPLDAASRLADGVRYTFPIDPRAELTVTVWEQRIGEAELRLITMGEEDDLQVGWLEENLVRTNGPLANDEGVQECLRMHRKLDAKRLEISSAVKQAERLVGRQDRLRENIKAGGQDELTSRWRTELDRAEQGIQEIEEQQLPALRDEEQALHAKLRTAVQSLSAEWFEVE